MGSHAGARFAVLVAMVALPHAKAIRDTFETENSLALEEERDQGFGPQCCCRGYKPESCYMIPFKELSWGKCPASLGYFPPAHWDLSMSIACKDESGIERQRPVSTASRRIGTRTFTIKAYFVSSAWSCAEALRQQFWEFVDVATYNLEATNLLDVSRPELLHAREYVKFKDSPLTEVGIMRAWEMGGKILETIREELPEGQDVYFFSSVVAKGVETARNNFPGETVHPLPYIADETDSEELRTVGADVDEDNVPGPFQEQMEKFVRTISHPHSEAAAARRRPDEMYKFPPTDEATALPDVLQLAANNIKFLATAPKEHRDRASEKRSSYKDFLNSFPQYLTEVLGERKPSNGDVIKVVIVTHPLFMEKNLEGCAKDEHGQAANRSKERDAFKPKNNEVWVQDFTAPVDLSLWDARLTPNRCKRMLHPIVYPDPPHRLCETDVQRCVWTEKEKSPAKKKTSQDEEDQDDPSPTQSQSTRFMPTEWLKRDLEYCDHCKEKRMSIVDRDSANAENYKIMLENGHPFKEAVPAEVEVNLHTNRDNPPTISGLVFQGTTVQSVLDELSLSGDGLRVRAGWQLIALDSNTVTDSEEVTRVLKRKGKNKAITGTFATASGLTVGTRPEDQRRMASPLIARAKEADYNRYKEMKEQEKELAEEKRRIVKDYLREAVVMGQEMRYAGNTPRSFGEFGAIYAENARKEWEKARKAQDKEDYSDKQSLAYKEKQKKLKSAIGNALDIGITEGQIYMKEAVDQLRSQFESGGWAKGAGGQLLVGHMWLDEMQRLVVEKAEQQKKMQESRDNLQRVLGSKEESADKKRAKLMDAIQGAMKNQIHPEDPALAEPAEKLKKIWPTEEEWHSMKATAPYRSADQWLVEMWELMREKSVGASPLEETAEKPPPRRPSTRERRSASVSSVSEQEPPKPEGPKENRGSHGGLTDSLRQPLLDSTVSVLQAKESSDLGTQSSVQGDATEQDEMDRK